MELDASQTVGKIATSLPGAAALFRSHGISFCCGGSDSIEVAAEAAGLSPETLVDELQGLVDAASTEAPDGTADLIKHLRTRYHDTHRAELISLIPLAAKVERVHGDHPDAPIAWQICWSASRATYTATCIARSSCSSRSWNAATIKL